MVLLALASCGGCNNNKSREKPDVSNIHLDVKIERFDQDLSGFKNKDYNQQAAAMRQKYGPFFDFYLQQFVIGPRPAGDTANIDEAALKKFILDMYIQRIQDSIDANFKDTKETDAQLTEALTYFKYYFPQATIPKVVAINSGFSLGAFTYDKDVLGIGLDFYLGADNPDYDSAGIYQYLHHKMTKKYIARNSMEVLYNLYFGGEDIQPGKTLVEAMADKGKKLYFLSYVLPDAPDSILTGFTADQVKWCEANEYEIWKFLNDKDLLYKDNVMEQKRYLDEGPGTTGMPAEAPGNIGSWIGLQIVRKYMKETGGKVSLQELVTKHNGQDILKVAKYRPSKSTF